MNSLKKPSPLVELSARRGLIGFDASRRNIGSEVVLAAHGITGHPSEKIDLADMSERVGDRSLEDLPFAIAQRL